MFVPVQGPAVNDGSFMSLNGGGVGAVGGPMGQLNWDPGYLRPFWCDRTNKPRVIVNTGRWTVEKGERRQIRESIPVSRVVNDMGIMHPVLMSANSTALRKEAWIQLDTAVIREARLRLRAYADLSAANSVGGFNAMNKTTYEYEAMDDPGEAIVDMDGISEGGRNDSARFSLRSIPLPITHANFSFSQRKLGISRGTDTPLDTSSAEWAARRVAETVEKTTIGVETGMTYGTQTGGVTAHTGTSTVWGYLNFPYRDIKSDYTAPTAGGWTPETTMLDINAGLEQLRQKRFYGPFILYNSTDWDQYLDGDYYVAKTSGAVAPTKTLRERIKQIDGIQDIRRLDFLDAATNPFTFILVQMTSDVARAINGQGVTTVQWETKGGMEINYMVYVIWVPQLRYTFAGRTGIQHGSTS